MVTKTTSVRAVSKAIKRPSKSSRKLTSASFEKIKTEKKGRDWQNIWVAREENYARIFGPSLPKDKVLSREGAWTTQQEGAREEFCILQYAPKPDRMGWVYVTHGLSQLSQKTGKGDRIELVLHWKVKDNKAPAQILSKVSNYILERGQALVRGDLISVNKLDAGVAGLPHWLICAPDRCMPAQIAAPCHFKFMLILGITDAEMQCAQRVKPELADGSQVLLEALRSSGILPVTDSARNCLTRRGDYRRLWENAYRAVREKME